MEEQKKELENTEENPDIDAADNTENEDMPENETVAADDGEAVEEAGDVSEEALQEENEEEDDSVGTIPLPKMARGFHISGRLMFQNEFTITKEIYLEFVKAFMSQYRKLYYVMGGVSVFLGLFSVLGGAVSSGFVFVLVGVVCLAMPFFLYRSSRDKKFAKQVENNGGKPLERKINFFSDGLEIFSNNGAHSIFQYSDITKIITSKNIYVLVIQKKLSLLVPKKSFVLGNLEEWKTFMAAKGKWKIK